MEDSSTIRRQLIELDDRRKVIEKTIAELTERLNDLGVGMDQSLVDAEGFPRADLDIASIRSDRQRVNMLTNDHKALSQQVESLLHRLHSVDASMNGMFAQAPNGHQHSTNVANGNVEITRAFGVIDEISEGSPAAEGGLQLHDKVLKFGNVTRETSDVLQEIARLLVSSEGREIEVLVHRNDQSVRLQVIPKRWEGRGLLGCHLQPI